MTWRRVAVFIVAGVPLSATAICGCPLREDPPPVTRYTCNVVQEYPHDPAAFTQGLLYYEGVFYESTGLNGQSSVRRVEIETGEVLMQHRLASNFFGEGLTLFGGRLIQLTWLSQTGFIYDVTDFSELETFRYTGQGWGLTHDGVRLIMSDGTGTLRFLDPETLEETGRVAVRNNGAPVNNLNELEYVEGEVFANVWLTDTILRIDPDTGEVLATIDCSGLLSGSEQSEAGVLNGIAYDPETKRLWVTGKRWPKLFEIELVPVGEADGANN